MSDHSVTHATFTLERSYKASPERVFHAWSDPAELREWSAPDDSWSIEHRHFEFTVGGVEITEFGPRGQVPFRVTGRFDDIVPNRRIVSAYAISCGPVRQSSSVSTIEFRPEGTGTKLVITEQGAYLDGTDSAIARKSGVAFQLTQLGAYLDTMSIPAQA